MSEKTASASPWLRLRARLNATGRRREFGAIAAFGAFLGLMVLLVAAPANPGDLAAWLERIVLVFAMLVYTALVLLLGIAVHEGGHLLVGRLVGFRFVSCRVGPITVTKTRYGFRMGPSTDTIRGGLARCYPMVGGHLRARYLAFVIGGPLATLMWIAVLMALSVGVSMLSDALAAAALLTSGATSVPTDFQAMAVAVPGLAWMSVVIWFIVLLVNCIPMRLREQPTDGLLIIRALRGDRSFERSLVLGGMRMSLAQGVRARAWSESLVRAALEPADHTNAHMFATLLAYTWVRDSGQIERAGAYLDEMITIARETSLWEQMRQEVALECAYFFARHRNDPEAAREWLEQGESAKFASFMRPRALAAILLAEGKPEEALDAARQGLAELAESTDELERLGTHAQPELEDLHAMAAEAHTSLAVARAS